MVIIDEPYSDWKIGDMWVLTEEVPFIGPYSWRASAGLRVRVLDLPDPHIVKLGVVGGSVTFHMHRGSLAGSARRLTALELLAEAAE